MVRFGKNAIYTCYAAKHSDSKFNNNYFERKLKVTMTTRNLNTMNKLVELSDAWQGSLPLSVALSDIITITKRRNFYVK